MQLQSELYSCALIRLKKAIAAKSGGGSSFWDTYLSDGTAATFSKVHFLQVLIREQVDSVLEAEQEETIFPFRRRSGLDGRISWNSGGSISGPGLPRENEETKLKGVKALCTTYKDSRTKSLLSTYPRSFVFIGQFKICPIYRGLYYIIMEAMVALHGPF